MQDFEKRIIELKAKIRIAINESGLPLSLTTASVDSIRAELIQIALNEAQTALIKAEKEAENVVHENNVGE